MNDYNKIISNNPLHILVIKKQCFCPSDCESTKYIFETSFSPRSPNDTALLIKSYTKKNKLMYNVKKEIQNLNNFCISSDEKQQRIKEFEQLNHSIAYTSTVLHFFWKEDIMVSYKRDERYTIGDMLCKLIIINFIKMNEYFYNFSQSDCSYFWRNDGMCHRNVCGCSMWNHLLDNIETYREMDKCNKGESSLSKSYPDV